VKSRVQILKMGTVNTVGPHNQQWTLLALGSVPVHGGSATKRTVRPAVTKECCMVTVGLEGERQKLTVNIGSGL